MRLSNNTLAPDSSSRRIPCTKLLQDLFDVFQRPNLLPVSQQGTTLLTKKRISQVYRNRILPRKIRRRRKIYHNWRPTIPAELIREILYSREILRHALIPVGEGYVLHFRVDVQIPIFRANGAIAAHNVYCFKRFGDCEVHFAAVVVTLVELLFGRVRHHERICV